MYVVVKRCETSIMKVKTPNRERSINALYESFWTKWLVSF